MIFSILYLRIKPSFKSLQVISSPKMTVFKNGKDDLSVKSMDLVMKDPKNEKNKTTYTCSAFTITGDCSTKTNKECSKEVICFKK